MRYQLERELRTREENAVKGRGSHPTEWAGDCSHSTTFRGERHLLAKWGERVPGPGAKEWSLSLQRCCHEKKAERAYPNGQGGRHAGHQNGRRKTARLLRGVSCRRRRRPALGKSPSLLLLLLKQNAMRVPAYGYAAYGGIHQRAKSSASVCKSSEGEEEGYGRSRRRPAHNLPGLVRCVDAFALRCRG